MLDELEDARRIEESYDASSAIRRLEERGTLADFAAVDGFARYIEMMSPRVEDTAGWSWQAARAFHRATGRLVRELDAWRREPG